MKLGLPKEDQRAHNLPLCLQIEGNIWIFQKNICSKRGGIRLGILVPLIVVARLNVSLPHVVNRARI